MERKGWIRIVVIAVVAAAAIAAGATGRLYGSAERSVIAAGETVPALTPTLSAAEAHTPKGQTGLTPTPKAQPGLTPTPTLPPYPTPTPEPAGKLVDDEPLEFTDDAEEAAEEPDAQAKENARRAELEAWEAEWEARHNRKLSAVGQILMALAAAAVAAACVFFVKHALRGFRSDKRAHGCLLAVTLLLSAAAAQHLVFYILKQYVWRSSFDPYYFAEQFVRFDLRMLLLFAGTWLALRKRNGTGERIACAIPMALLVWTILSVPADYVIAPYSNPPASVPGDMRYECFFLVSAILLRIHMRHRIQERKAARRARRKR